MKYLNKSELRVSLIIFYEYHIRKQQASTNWLVTVIFSISNIKYKLEKKIKVDIKGSP